MSEFFPFCKQHIWFWLFVVILVWRLKNYCNFNRHWETISLKQTGQFIETLSTLTWPYKTQEWVEITGPDKLHI